MSAPSPLPLGVVAPFLFAALSALASALVYPWLRRVLARVQPELRWRYLLALAFAPIACSFVLTLLTLLPSLVAWLWPSLDHCAAHQAAGHPHLCLLHPTPQSAGGLGIALVAAVVLVAFGLALQQGMRLIAASSLVRRLTFAARRDRTLGAHVFEAGTPLALTAGTLEQTIFISTGLLSSLSPAQVDVVLAHERAHVARREPFFRFIASLASVFHLPWTRRQLLHDLHLASEQCCDLAAVARSSAPFVAKTLLDVHRLVRQHRAAVPAQIVAFGEHHLEERVELLLAVPSATASWSPRLKRFAGAVLLTAALLLMEPVHHSAETLLGYFAR